MTSQLKFRIERIKPSGEHTKDENVQSNPLHGTEYKYHLAGYTWNKPGNKNRKEENKSLSAYRNRKPQQSGPAACHIPKQPLHFSIRRFLFSILRS